MKVFVFLDGDVAFSDFLEINTQPDLDFVQVGPEFTSSESLLAFSSSEDGSFCLIVSSRVVFPEGFRSRILSLVERVEATIGSWGVIGETGLTTFPVGPYADFFVSYSRGVSSLPSNYGSCLPASSLAPSCLLVNCAVLSSLSQSPEPGHRESFRSTELLICASREQGLRVLLAPELSVFLRRREPSNFLMDLTDSKCKPGANTSARAFLGERRSLTIVTRTRFSNLNLFYRCVKSVAEFKAACQSLEIKHIVVSDAAPPLELQPEHSYDHLIFERRSDDSRFTLIQDVLPKIQSDFVMFLDDDDWLIAESSQEIEHGIFSYPKNCVFHLGATVFSESLASDRSLESSRVSHTVPAQAARTAFLGFNQTPFSAVLWPLEVLARIPSQAFGSITLLEDLYVLLTSWTSSNVPVFLPYDFAQISIRGTGNSQNQKNRSEWIRAQANLGSLLALDPNWQHWPASINIGGQKKPGGVVLLNALASVLNPQSVRYFFKLRILSRLLSREMTLKELFSKLSIRSTTKSPSINHTHPGQNPKK